MPLDAEIEEEWGAIEALLRKIDFRIGEVATDRKKFNHFFLLTLTIILVLGLIAQHNSNGLSIAGYSISFELMNQIVGFAALTLLINVVILRKNYRQSFSQLDKFSSTLSELSKNLIARNDKTKVTPIEEGIYQLRMKQVNWTNSNIQNLKPLELVFASRYRGFFRNL